MLRTLLYEEFDESRTSVLVCNVKEFSDALQKVATLNGKRLDGIIVEYGKEKYKIYYSDNDLNENSIWNLKIEPAARVRFEGSIYEIEKLMNDIVIDKISNDSGKVFCSIKQGEISDDFVITDIYYTM
ncbi:DUF5975 family protein [Butyrivibrio sp. YAB3001]|uniref:DUF5975 family protein n=1 Tax=Butyrivibrio sp. YAB3001 TaxID=1520812 RepID=UPI0008F63F99|nr:DUF5975 family protein [Butyrivibrio sp. YAB3001]SFC02028.1 hypothetical protein SAMN02910398_01337 [Butyrivibrio sp. YAB3001]